MILLTAGDYRVPKMDLIPFMNIQIFPDFHKISLNWFQIYFTIFLHCHPNFFVTFLKFTQNILKFSSQLFIKIL